MKKIFFVTLCMLLFPAYNFAQMVNNFSIENFRLSDQAGKKAIVVVFTSSHCKFATQYIERLNQLYNAYTSQGVSFLAINSNDGSINPNDDQSAMRAKAIYYFSYVKDHDQNLAKMFNATKNPEAFILTPSNGQYNIAYKGQIDDNPLDENMVHSKSLENALKQVLAGQTPTSAGAGMGCPIRMMR